VNNAIKNLNDATTAANASAGTIAQAVSAAVAQGTDPNLTLSGVPADAKATGDVIGELKSTLSNIDNVLFNSTLTNCTLANGTLVNAGNGDAVNTITQIPCTKGDTVEIYPIRLNTTGYYYQYTYIVYDSSGSVLVNAFTATTDNKKINIVNDSAAYVRFAIF